MDKAAPIIIPASLEPTAKPDHTPVPGLTPTQDDAAALPEDAKFTRGPAFLDIYDLFIVGAQYELHLVGSTPTPCNALRVAVAPPDDQNRIIVDVYSVSNPKGVCADVLAPFDVQVPLGTNLVGTFTIWIYGQEVGQIQVPVVD